jgi:hypothetical protein
MHRRNGRQGGHANGIGNTLTERAGRCLDTVCMTIFRMASRNRTKLAEVFNLLDGHVLIA